MKEHVGLRYNRGLIYRVYEGLPQIKKKKKKAWSSRKKKGIGYEQGIHKIEGTNGQ